MTATLGAMFSRLSCIALGSIFLTAAAFACGGKLAPEDVDTTNPSKSQRPRDDDSDDTKADRAKTKPPVGGTTTSSPPSRPPSFPPAPSSTCELQGGSSSGTMDGTSPYCQSEYQYKCSTGERKLECLCAWENGTLVKGRCGCDGDANTTFDFDCKDGCIPGPKEYAQCKLPADG